MIFRSISYRPENNAKNTFKIFSIICSGLANNTDNINLFMINESACILLDQMSSDYVYGSQLIEQADWRIWMVLIQREQWLN